MFVDSGCRARRMPHLVLAVVLVAGACSASAAKHQTAAQPVDAAPAAARGRPSAPPAIPPAGAGLGPLDRVVLTTEGFDSYQLLGAGDSLGVVTGEANKGGNVRVIYVQREGRVAEDEQVCATWSGEQGPVVQEGLALRVVPGLGEPGQAITVTKNVWGGYPWVLNVHVWNGGSGQWQLHGIAGLDFFPALEQEGVLAPMPWRVCARTEQAVLTVKVWIASQPEPGWDDPLHVQRTLVPAVAMRPGRVGWYAGHLRPGNSVRYDDMGSALRP